MTDDAFELALPYGRSPDSDASTSAAAQVEGSRAESPTESPTLFEIARSEASSPASDEASDSPPAGSQPTGSQPPGGQPSAGFDADLFLNRELSWLEFNERVLEEARDPTVPLLERLKFLSICVANLEEFFMVRVAGLLEQRNEEIMDLPPDGMSPAEQLEAISARTQRMYKDIGATVSDELLPKLQNAGVVLTHPSKLKKSERTRLRAFFREQVFPILTPLAIDPGHPFPHVPNKRLHLIIMLSGKKGGEPAFAIVQVPDVLPRLIPVRSKEHQEHQTTFVLLDDVIGEHAGELFRGFRQRGAWCFRVIRNFDLSIDEEEAEDLLEMIKKEVRRRDRGNAVHLAHDARCAPEAVDMLRKALGVDRQFVFPVDMPLPTPDITALGQPLAERRDLRDPAWNPSPAPEFSQSESVFEAIKRRDILLHHPYESFDPVVNLVEEAANDPDVLAIKQTLYRTSGDSPIVKALTRAAENGKQVAALVEIKARFDEENNILWARELEESGVHVVYGLVGLKTHCKVILIVRREGGQLRRYVHFGTGNYNPRTARLYTDLSFFTSRWEFGEDATALFNLLTSCTPPREWRKLIVAPLGMHEQVLGLIEREASFARTGRGGRIIAKMNSLVDPDVIQGLYRASQAGVHIELIVRGICCLRPGIPGLSENIEVRSVVDRFLEHSRIFYFGAGGANEVYGSSADWMPRNFHRRVEVMFPIEEEALRDRVATEILGISLADNTKARLLEADGSYRPVDPPSEQGDTEECRSQRRFRELAKAAHAQASARARSSRTFIVRPVRQRPTKEADPAVAVSSDDGASTDS